MRIRLAPRMDRVLPGIERPRGSLNCRMPNGWKSHAAGDGSRFVAFLGIFTDAHLSDQNGPVSADSGDFSLAATFVFRRRSIDYRRHLWRSISLRIAADCQGVPIARCSNRLNVLHFLSRLSDVRQRANRRANSTSTYGPPPNFRTSVVIAPFGFGMASGRFCRAIATG